MEKDTLNEPIDIEAEKQIFGEALYKVKDDLPSLIIDKYEENWINVFKMVHSVFNQFGGDITSLYAEITLLYDIKEIEDLEDEKKNAIRVTYLIIRGLLSHAMLQAQENIDTLQAALDNKDVIKITEITGDGYYFIPIALNNIFSYYNMLLNFIFHRMYLNEEFIESIRERLNYLISPEFEGLRKTFMVAECWEIKRKAEENKITLH